MICKSKWKNRNLKKNIDTSIRKYNFSEAITACCNQLCKSSSPPARRKNNVIRRLGDRGAEGPQTEIGDFPLPRTQLPLPQSSFTARFQNYHSGGSRPKRTQRRVHKRFWPSNWTCTKHRFGKKMKYKQCWSKCKYRKKKKKVKMAITLFPHIVKYQ